MLKLYRQFSYITVGGIPAFFMIGGSMELDQNNIISTINKYLFEENLELYDINIVNFPNISKIEVYVYSSSSLDYKTIERLNFQIQRLLEEINIQKGTYKLIVSSPGIERLLKTNRHYEISQQELIKVKLIEPFFLDKDLSFSTGIGYSEKDYSDTAAYNLNVFNINAGLNYPIIDDLYHDISLEYDLKDYEVTNASLVSSSIAASEGTNANFYLNNRLTYNKLNSFIRPTKGSSIQYVNVLSPITNSTNGIIKNIFQYKKYIPLNRVESKIKNILIKDNQKKLKTIYILLFMINIMFG